MAASFGPKIPQLFVSALLGDNYYTAGEALLRGLQALVQLNVINLTTSIPPGIPSNGDTYVVAASPSPSGAWTGQANKIAYWSTDNPTVPSGEWEFYTPLAGWIVGNQTDGKVYAYNGSSWAAIAASVEVAGTPLSSSTLLNLVNTGNVTFADEGGGSVSATAAQPSRVSAFFYTIDGGGSAPSTGAWGQLDVPMNCTITGWVLTADQAGDAVVDVLRSTYAGFPTVASIASSDKPTLAGSPPEQKNENLAVSVWTTALHAGDQLQFNVNSASTVTRLNLTILITIP